MDGFIKRCSPKLCVQTPCVLCHSQSNAKHGTRQNFDPEILTQFYAFNVSTITTDDAVKILT